MTNMSTFEKAEDIDAIWLTAQQNQQIHQPRYTQHHKQFDRNHTHSRYKTKKPLTQEASESKKCKFHPNSRNHTSDECRKNPKKEPLKCEHCPHLSNHTTDQCKRKPKTLIMESPSQEPITGTMTVAHLDKSIQAEYTLDTGASYTTINTELHQTTHF